MKKYVFLFLIIALLSACEKQLEINVYDNYQPKLGINSIFSADSTFKVWVYKSAAPGTFSKDDFITNATVTLYEDGNMLEQLSLATDSIVGYYVSTHKARSGHVYRIEAEADGLHAWAVDSVPETPVFEVKDIVILDSSVHVFTDSLNRINKDISFKARVTLEIPSTTDYYYIFSGYNYYVGSKQSFDFYSNFDMTNRNVQFDLVGNLSDMYASALLYTPDYYQPGNLLVSFEFTTEVVTSDDTGKLYFEVAKLSKDLYEFYTSLSLYQSTQGNPFVEPVNVRVNVHDGLGLFAAYSMAIDSVEINF